MSTKAQVAGTAPRLARSTPAGPFQAFEWAVYSDGLQPLLALVWRDDVIVGIIPLALHPRPAGGDNAVFTGTGMSDYLDWLLDADADPARVLDELLSQLAVRRVGAGALQVSLLQ